MTAPQVTGYQGSAAAGLILRALRCWRSARDEGTETQPRLFGALDRQEGVLAPVMDSLFLFYEAALGRRLTAGRPGRMSEDESLLIDIIAGPADTVSCRGRIGCDPGRAQALDCALCSARVMLSLALPARAA